MSKVTLGFGGFLILFGILSYIFTGASSFTALIPTFIGIPMLAAGYAQTLPRWRSFGLWGAVALAAIMIVGSYRGLSALVETLTGGATLGTPAILQVILVVLSLIFLIYAFTAGRITKQIQI
jgi:hypothetical protein